MKYFKKPPKLGDNKEKLWAAVLKLLEIKEKPERFSSFKHIIEK